MEKDTVMEQDAIMQEDDELQLLSQYRWSFTARLHQAPEQIAAYYSEIKNAFLAYKKVKSRISWGCDTINFGRDQLAKMVITTKTLYVYLALDPNEFVDSKYFFRDYSEIKKYEKVPMRIKVRSERGVRHVLELIEKLVEKYELTPAKNFEAQDYSLPYKTFEELLELQLIKKIEARVEEEAENLEAVAAAVVVEEPVVEEPVVEEPAVEEPVVEEPAKEEPAEEEPAPAAEPVPPVQTIVEETPAEEIQNADLLNAETIHVAFLDRLCRQFDADELNAHVKIVYKKKREKKTSVFDIVMRRNRQ